MKLVDIGMGLLQFFIVLCLSPVFCQNAIRADSSLFPTEGSTASPCEACRMLTASFAKGMEETSRGKLEGGDAAREADRLGSYATSEVRLVEIRERLCRGLGKGKAQRCHKLAEETERTVEEWWFRRQTEEPDLYEYLCVESARACCPERHFGPDCAPCDRCSGNGVCDGSGTRGGTGRCACDEGYAGEKCSHCAAGSYEAYRDDDKLLCSRCHASCAGRCKGAGPGGCGACREGWVMEKGCRDVDECSSPKACRPREFCVNTEGSFACLPCDRGCEGCHGDGPDECTRCAEGYVLRGKLCVDEGTLGREAQVSTARYMTYFGLCLATCIIFQKSTVVAAIIGLSVALYISVSEYMLSSHGESDAESGNLLVPTS